MPERMRQAEGALQSLTGVDEDGTPQSQPLYTPEERDFFAALGLDVLNPEERNETNLRRMLRQPAVH